LLPLAIIGFVAESFGSISIGKTSASFHVIKNA